MTHPTVIEVNTQYIQTCIEHGVPATHAFTWEEYDDAGRTLYHQTEVTVVPPEEEGEYHAEVDTWASGVHWQHYELNMPSVAAILAHVYDRSK